MSDLEQARSFFANDRYATEATGAIIDAVAPHYAKIRLTLEDRHRNAMGAVMGGALFTLADFAFAVASNWQGTPTVSLTSQISYLNSPKGSQLFAEAECIKSGRSTCCYHIRITDDLDTLAAEVTTTGFIIQNK